MACRHWEALAHAWKKELRTAAGGSKNAELRLRLGVVYRHLASTFESAGEVHAAVRSLESALNFDVSVTVSADPIGTRVRVGGAYLACGYERDAARTFRQALRISRTPSVRVAVGHAYMQHGRSEAANEQFQQVRKSRDPRANAAIGRLFIGAGREKEAIPYLERAVSLDALDPSIYLDLAYAVAFGQQDFARASAELTNAQRAANLSGHGDLLPEIESARRLLDEVTASTQHKLRSGRERW